MRWLKKGVIFAPDGRNEWAVSHATLPVVDDVGGGRLRIYFASRDRANRSHPSYIEVDADDPGRALYVHDRPVLPLGPAGTFDDSGIAPSWLVSDGGRKLLYYIGWNPQVTVSYRLSVGLAVSTDGGKSFTKHSAGPVCDRDMDEPYFCTAPCVIKEGGLWRMWYVSCTGWMTVDGRPEPAYHVKYAESSDGVRWQRIGHVCVDFDETAQAIGRPCVFKDGDRYKMLYSYRSVRGYREDPARSYRLGYAESADGRIWERKDGEVGIARSPEGWDSQMIEYCYVHTRPDATFLFYNGNGFGKSGVGYAVLDRG